MSHRRRLYKMSSESAAVDLQLIQSTTKRTATAAAATTTEIDLDQGEVKEGKEDGLQTKHELHSDHHIRMSPKEPAAEDEESADDEDYQPNSPPVPTADIQRSSPHTYTPENDTNEMVEPIVPLQRIPNAPNGRGRRLSQLLSLPSTARPQPLLQPPIRTYTTQITAEDEPYFYVSDGSGSGSGSSCYSSNSSSASYCSDPNCAECSECRIISPPRSSSVPPLPTHLHRSTPPKLKEMKIPQRPPMDSNRPPSRTLKSVLRRIRSPKLRGPAQLTREVDLSQMKPPNQEQAELIRRRRKKMLALVGSIRQLRPLSLDRINQTRFVSNPPPSDDIDMTDEDYGGIVLDEAAVRQEESKVDREWMKEWIEHTLDESAMGMEQPPPNQPPFVCREIQSAPTISHQQSSSEMPPPILQAKPKLSMEFSTAASLLSNAPPVPVHDLTGFYPLVTSHYPRPQPHHFLTNQTNVASATRPTFQPTHIQQPIDSGRQQLHNPQLVQPMLSVQQHPNGGGVLITLDDDSDED